MRVLAPVVLILLAVTLSAQQVALTPVATGLPANPVALTHANDARLFVTLQDGRVMIIENGALRATPFLDIRDIVRFGGEQGLLSTAFHPDYAQNGFFFVFHNDKPDGNVNIARYHVSADPNVADPASRVLLLTIPHSEFTNHNGGQMAFGPDGLLYIGTGDGGSGGDPNNNGQNLQALLGKILRIDVNAPTYTIPPSNPFVGNANARGEIWAYGLRNPWRFSFDRVTGDLFIADVGQGSWEEIDFQPAGSAGGANYGWRIMEGTHCYNPLNCSSSGLALPIIEYDHTGGACSVTGGYRYRGSRSTRLAGKYVYGDYCTGVIWGATQNPNGTWSSTQLIDAPFNISSFGESSTGELFVADYPGRRVLAIGDPAAPSITSINPNAGGSGGGESVTITGTNLANPTSVTFGSTAASVMSSSTSSITLIAPPAPQLGNVSVVVTTNGGSDSITYRYDLGAPTNVVAVANGTTSVVISWNPVPHAVSYEVIRSVDHVNYVGAGSMTTASVIDDGLVPNTSYLYKVRAFAPGTASAFSAADLATTVMFTDDPLSAGTLAKAEHVRHLRVAVNAVRVLGGLDPVEFTDDPITSRVTVIRATHQLQLRNALNQGRSAAGLPPLSFTDPSLAIGSLIKAADVVDLRTGVK